MNPTEELRADDGLRLTLTFEFVGRVSIEAGIKFAQAWMIDQTGADADGVRVAVVRGEELTVATSTPGERVRRRRRRLGLTQRQLGDLAGVTHVAVCYVETDRSGRLGRAYPAILDALAKAEDRR